MLAPRPRSRCRHALHLFTGPHSPPPLPCPTCSSSCSPAPPCECGRYGWTISSGLYPLITLAAPSVQNTWEMSAPSCRQKGSPGWGRPRPAGAVRGNGQAGTPDRIDGLVREGGRTVGSSLRSVRQPHLERCHGCEEGRASVLPAASHHCYLACLPLVLVGCKATESRVLGFSKAAVALKSSFAGSCCCCMLAGLATSSRVAHSRARSGTSRATCCSMASLLGGAATAAIAAAANDRTPAAAGGCALL